MQDKIFETVDTYIDGLFASEDVILESIRDRARAAGLPEIEVSAGQGKFLYLMAKLTGATRMLEVGTLGGYSTVWMARALPEGGQMTTLELDAAHAAFARETFRLAALEGVCHMIEGPALQSLQVLEGPFDLVFLDANKDQYPDYLEEAARLLAPGGLFMADNVIRKGAVIDPPVDDVMARGAAEFNRRLSSYPQFESIVLQQVGRKGHDGLAVARKRA
ncbi:O-methyltransferase [Hyphomonas oceanitis]|uniref:O-methyltransferase family protein n=1 Tax=Hyphomonas oceanitis SCH89 TaxID=1280953 RepID=A0A059GC58_9PROT|nr:O-methyltransferase [Hyphomonas oceanitis]KDA04093.1 O-methyltransferase family protein [Hyphomonas oceanitis SCH89]